MVKKRREGIIVKSDIWVDNRKVLGVAIAKGRIVIRSETFWVGVATPMNRHVDTARHARAFLAKIQRDHNLRELADLAARNILKQGFYFFSVAMADH